MGILTSNNKKFLCVGEKYARRDLRKILNIPGDRGGEFDTGMYHYRQNGADEWYLFVSMDVETRTGHEYANHYEGEYLVWRSRNGRQTSSPSMQSLLSSETVYVFIRNESRGDFEFKGQGYAVSYENKEADKEKYVMVRWAFSFDDEDSAAILTKNEPSPQTEGGKKFHQGFRYARAHLLRKKCIDLHGCRCSVCGFDFEETFGKIGEGFIHVHHLIPISQFNGEHLVSAESDLRPICPNCHAMIHQKTPPYTIEELRSFMKNK